MVKFRSHAMIIIGRIVRYQLILLAISVFMGLFFGKFNLASIGLYWAYLGAFIMCFSCLSLMGGWGATRSFDYQYGMTIGTNVIDRTNAVQKELRMGESFFFSTFAQAIWAVLGGFLINMLAG